MKLLKKLPVKPAGRLRKSHVKSYARTTASGKRVMVKEHDDKRTRRQGEQHSQRRQRDLQDDPKRQATAEAGRKLDRLRAMTEDVSAEQFEKDLPPGMGQKTPEALLAYLNEGGSDGHLAAEQVQKKLEAGGKAYLRMKLSPKTLEGLKGIDKNVEVPADYDNDDPVIVANGEVIDGRHRVAAAIRDGRGLSAYIPAREWHQKVSTMGQEQPQEDKKGVSEGGGKGKAKEKPPQSKKQGQPDTQLEGLGLPARLVEKCRRRAKGQGGEIQLSKPEVNLLLTKGVVGMISAGKNPELEKDFTDEQAKERHEKLRADLKEKGLMHTQVLGKYGEEEDSFLVFTPDVTRDELVELGAKYNQDSVIWSKGEENQMIYTTGPNKGKYHPGKGFEEIGQKAKDFFTEFTGPKGEKSRFSLNFDFDSLQKAMRRIGMRLRKGREGHVRRTKSGKVVMVK